MSEFALTDQLVAWGVAHGYHRSELELHADWFSDYLTNRTKKYKDVNAAFRNCVRSDWGSIRRQMKKPVNQLPDDAVVRMGESRGIYALPGESMPTYRRRVLG
jgi:hypothetical protein